MTKPAIRMKVDKIYDAEFAVREAELDAYADFVAVIRQLRRDCPWDREQTHESVKHLLIEEAYETVAAIDEEDWDELKKELGDLFLHVVFHSVIAEQGARFTLTDVIQKETEKLVRRHPHVFGDVDVDDVDDVLRNWEQIKLQEGEKKSALEGVPRHLPALLRAYRIQQKASGVGFDFPESDGAWGKVEEEIREFKELVDEDAPASKREEEFGDLLFALVNYARFAELNPENALSRTNDKFARRFRHIEERLHESGTTMAEADLESMDEYWEEAKSKGG